MPELNNSRHIVFLRLMPPIIVWGGLEKLKMEWFDRIDYSQCRVTLVVSTGSGEIYSKHIRERKLPIEVVEFPFRVNFQYVDGFWGRFSKLLQLLKTLKPHLVLFFQGSFTDFDLAHILAANIAAKGKVYMHENLGAPVPSVKSSKKYFGFIPGIALWWFYERYSAPLRARFCDRIYVVSAEIRKRMIDLWKYPADKLEVMYHGVDIQRYHPSEINRQMMRTSLGIPENDKIIIVAARLSQEKCIDRAIDAFESLSLDNPNLNLIIAGTGPYEDRLKTHAAKKSSNKRIRFLGQVSNVNELYQMSDIYVLSSDNEGLSLAFLEALASGLVCVVTNCTGTTEVINDGINGFIVEKSTEGVLGGIKKALNLSIRERQNISQTAVSYIHQNFEISRNVKKSLLKLSIPIKETSHSELN